MIGMSVVVYARHAPQILDTGHASAVAYSPDGRLLATVGDDGVQVWDAHTGQPVGTLQHIATQLAALAFAADGRTVVGASSDGIAWAWNTTTGKLIGTATFAQGYDSNPLSISPNGNTLITENCSNVQLQSINDKFGVTLEKPAIFTVDDASPLG